MDDEFVNGHTSLADLRHPHLITQVNDGMPAWSLIFPRYHSQPSSLLGPGLNLALYDKVLTLFLGGEDPVLMPVPVIGNCGHLTIKTCDWSHQM